MLSTFDPIKLFLLLLSTLSYNIDLSAQGSEDLSGLPTNSPSFYLSRSWTGTNGVVWNANSARTDRTINGKAICFGTTGDRRIISPAYSGGIGTLSFNYVRDFSGSAPRVLEIWINGNQIGAPINVDPLSDQVIQYQQQLNIDGPIALEIRSIGAGQVKLDDISWTAYTTAPTISFTAASSIVNENDGTLTIDLALSEPAISATSLEIGADYGTDVTYGAAGDHITLPASSNGTLTLPLPAGSTSISFDLTLIDDQISELDEQLVFTLNSSGGGIQIGTPATRTITIQDNDGTTGPTILSPGDLVIVGVNTNDQACGGGNGEDQISFFSFKPISTGTSIILTDNGFQRCNTGMWGNSEGTVRLQRTGGTIPPGQVITFRFVNNFGPGNVVALAPDNGWTCASLNGNTAVNLNAGGDQLFIMQGGNWTTGTIGSHNATYDGTILFGFTSNPAQPWSASCSSSPSQRSDLPSGIECFSMAPTLATDYNKYSGPISGTTQRNWIIRLDDPINWSSYTGCSAYNGQGNDWLSAPILPITSGSFQAGRWTGAISTDWFECKNWDDARIPTEMTDVLIDQEAIRNCVVGLSPGVQPGGNGLCASLSLISSGISRNITIAPNSTLNVGGPIEVERTAGTGAVSITVEANATLSGTDLLLNGIDQGEAQLIADPSTSSIILEGGITIGGNSFVDLGGTMSVGGNWNNLASEPQFQENYGKVIFNGSADQNIFSIDPQEFFHDLSIEKNGGDVQLSSPVAINGILDLSNGLIKTTTTEMLTLGAAASAVNASDQSFVSGPMQKIGNSDLTFPIGKGNTLRPCALRDIVGSTNDAFIAEYFQADPGSALGEALQPTLDHISQCEYWNIEASAGSPDAVVELSWETPESCGITDPDALRVARWNGTQWLDRGNGGITGDPSEGTISTTAVQDVFGAWTLGSVDGSNPLPVTLVSFTAEKEDRAVRLEWTTASEMNNDHFTIERSENGIDFTDLIVVEAVGTSNGLLQYAELDPSPVQGINYYRLRQTDIDGTSTTSSIVTVRMENNIAMTVISTSSAITAYHDFSEESSYEIFDAQGRLILKGSSDLNGSTVITDAAIGSGAYLLRICEGSRSESVRFIR